VFINLSARRWPNTRKDGNAVSNYAPFVVAHGKLAMSGVSLRVYMLDDGSRVINADDVVLLFRVWASPHGADPTQDEIAAFAKWQKG
jgi:hypothetical protein